MALQQKDGGSWEVCSASCISQWNEKEYYVPDTINFKYRKVAAKSKGLGWKKFFMKEDEK